jgi:hypothetical protein
VDTKIKLKGAYHRALRIGTGASLMLLAASGLQADALWSNGAVNFGLNPGNSGHLRCDSGSSTCGSANPWTVFDNFNVPSMSKAWVVSSFDFTDFLVNTATGDYKNTSWSIWNGDPLMGGKLVASGNAPASLSNVTGTCGAGNICSATFTVNLSSSVALASGNTYFLGTNNSITENNINETTVRAFAAGGNTAPGGTLNSLKQWEQSNGSTSGVVGSTWTGGAGDNTFPGPLGITEAATAFDINGTLAPEPGTLTLLGIALAGLCFVLRRRVA